MDGTVSELEFECDNDQDEIFKTDNSQLELDMNKANGFTLFLYSISVQEY